MTTLLGFRENQKLPHKNLCMWRIAGEQNQSWDQRRRRAGGHRVCTCCKAQAPPAEQPCSPSSPGTSSALPSFPGGLLKCPLQTEQGSREQSSSQSTPRVFPNTPTATTATLSLPSCRQTLEAPSQGILVLFSPAKKAE